MGHFAKRMVGAFFFAALMHATGASAARYSVYELGSVDGGWSYASSISSNGLAAGHVTFNIAGQYRPALLARGALPTPIFTDTAGQATGVNAKGEVVGWFNQGDTSFLWNGSTITSLPSLGTGRTVALAINDRSDAVGWSHVSPGVAHAFLYRDGVMTDLGDWGGDAGSQANAVNQQGDVTGTRLVTQPNGLLVINEGVRVLAGKVESIQALVVGALHVSPMSINIKGDLAGTAFDPDGSHTAFALIGRKAASRIKFPTAIGSDAISINDSGQVVGNSDTGPATRIRAFLWERGKIVDLTSLPEVQAAGWTWLQEATAINNDGVIVGFGSNGSSAGRAFMLVPIKGRK